MKGKAGKSRKKKTRMGDDEENGEDDTGIVEKADVSDLDEQVGVKRGGSFPFTVGPVVVTTSIGAWDCCTIDQREIRVGMGVKYDMCDWVILAFLVMRVHPHC